MFRKLSKLSSHKRLDPSLIWENSLKIPSQDKTDRELLLETDTVLRQVHFSPKFLSQL